MDEYVNCIGATLSMQINNEIEAFVVRSVKACAPFDEDITINAKKIYEAIKNAEIYKWHDLRKNPEDLPAVEERVVLTLDLVREYRNVYGHRAKNGAWVVNGFETRSNVIAWRADEPFEEVEE